MWTTMAVMAFGVIFEPVRVALVVLMLNRPRPMLQLFAFLCVGFTACVAFGLIVLFILRTPPVPGGGITAAKVQIGIGVFALIVAVALASNLSGRTLISRRTRVGAVARGDAGVIVEDAQPPSRVQRLSTRARSLLEGDSLWVAAVSGLFNLPSANYMAALAVILASGASPSFQIQSLLVFNVVAFTLVGFPLVTYLVAPHKTRAFMSALHGWLRSLRRRDVAALLATAGCILLTLGLISL